MNHDDALLRNDVRRRAEEVVESVIREMNRSNLGISVKDWALHVKTRRANAARVVADAIAQVVAERDGWIGRYHALERFPETERARTIAQQAEEIKRLQAALDEIEARVLFHPDQVRPDELKAQLRAIGKLAHAFRDTDPRIGGNDGR